MMAGEIVERNWPPSAGAIRAWTVHVQLDSGPTQTFAYRAAAVATRRAGAHHRRTAGANARRARWRRALSAAVGAAHADKRKFIYLCHNAKSLI